MLREYAMAEQLTWHQCHQTVCLVAVESACAARCCSARPEPCVCDEWDGQEKSCLVFCACMHNRKQDAVSDTNSFHPSLHSVNHMQIDSHTILHIFTSVSRHKRVLVGTLLHTTTILTLAEAWDIICCGHVTHWQNKQMKGGGTSREWWGRFTWGKQLQPAPKSPFCAYTHTALK